MLGMTALYRWDFRENTYFFKFEPNPTSPCKGQSHAAKTALIMLGVQILPNTVGNPPHPANVAQFWSPQKPSALNGKSKNSCVAIYTLDWRRQILPVPGGGDEVGKCKELTVVPTAHKGRRCDTAKVRVLKLKLGLWDSLLLCRLVGGNKPKASRKCNEDAVGEKGHHSIT